MDKKMMQKMADTIRFLSADMVQRANSGHPGAPMGLADIVTVLSSHLKHNPKNSKWVNRDRLVFSGGHASPLVYSLLYLWGYDMEIEDLKQFRQLGSKTEGHPEFGHVDGVEITTGPLGQGIANAVGFSMASQYAKTLLNRENAEIIDHKVYCLCGDGDLQEGISYEACALAGVHALDNLVLIYDSNNITIEGSTDIAWNEDVKGRFEAQNWNVKEIDGHNFKQIDAVFEDAKKQTKPLLIIANTTIAKGADKMEGSHHAHGAPLGDEEIAIAKKKAGFEEKLTFNVPEDVLIRFRCAIEEGDLAQRNWEHSLKQMPYQEQNILLERLQNPDFSEISWPEFESGTQVATRDSNGKILNAIAKSMPGFIGGSADLAPSNKTELKDMGDFPHGKNLHFGIREHSMAAISNAIALYGLFNTFSATFFVFSDYLKPAARIAALASIQQFFVWTHDSIGVGEDGPTHQPIEHLSQFRALPNFYVFRPADANENIASWKIALGLKSPSGFVLSRQKLPVVSSGYVDVSKGAYRLKGMVDDQVTLIATGSEVSLAIEVREELSKQNITCAVVSVPCYDLLIEQNKSYIDSIIPPKSKRVAIEAARGLEWYRFADDVIAMDGFGASGPAPKLFDHFGFNAITVAERIKSSL